MFSSDIFVGAVRYDFDCRRTIEGDAIECCADGGERHDTGADCRMPQTAVPVSDKGTKRSLGATT